MKIIVENSTKEITHAFADDVNIDVQDTQVIVGPAEKPNFTAPYLNSSNCTVHTNITLPSDWFGRKYKYEDSSVTVNSGYIAVGDTSTTDVAADATTIPVRQGKVFVSSGGTLTNDDTKEKFTYTGIDGNNLTGCTRGVDGTTAAILPKNNKIHTPYPE
jgi:hypothetical protein|tara:strand:+ start:84 stop:560 length:477 start_codon:yes stop_codon:yes gene_type:complete